MKWISPDPYPGFSLRDSTLVARRHLRVLVAGRSLYWLLAFCPSLPVFRVPLEIPKQSFSTPPLRHENPRSPSTRRHRGGLVRIGYRLGFGRSVSFSNQPFQFRSLRDITNHTSSSRRGNIQSRGPGLHDDGFVLPDVSGNVGGRTWNWAYTRDDQVEAGTLRLSRKSSQSRRSDTTAITHLAHAHSFRSRAERDISQDPSHGAEIVYEHDLLRGGRFTLGLEAAFAFNRLSAASTGVSVVPVFLNTKYDFRATSVLSGFDTSLVDSFALDGVIAPLAPYTGSFEGPSAVIAASPHGTSSRNVDISPIPSSFSQSSTYRSHVEAVVDGTHEFNADIYAFRFGPSAEMALTDRLSASLSAGIALNLVDADAAYSESIFVPASGGSLSRSGRNSERDLLFGGYIEARFALRMSKRISVYTAGQLNFSQSFEHTVGNKTVNVDMGSAFSLGTGLQIEF